MSARMLTTVGGQPVSRLVLSGRPNRKPVATTEAFRAGINCFFFYSTSHLGMTTGIAAVLREQPSADIFVITGSKERDLPNLEASLEAATTAVGRKLIDAFLLEYVVPGEDLDLLAGPGGLLEQLAVWRAEGRVRYVGASVHDRGTAEVLLNSGRLDILMHRYNMAHRGAEARVLPTAARLGVPVIAFTATRWGSLLSGHPDWRAAPPTAAKCYRFVLGAGGGQVVLFAPRTKAELREDLQVLETPEMSDQERAGWRTYGDLIYGSGTDSFETEWP